MGSQHKSFRGQNEKLVFCACYSFCGHYFSTYTILKQITTDTISYLHHAVSLLPSPVLLVSQKIQREGCSARKAREICEMKRYHGPGGRASHWLNMRLSKEKNLKMVSRTGQEKIMRGDTYKHEELKKKERTGFIRGEKLCCWLFLHPVLNTQL